MKYVNIDMSIRKKIYNLLKNPKFFASRYESYLKEFERIFQTLPRD